MANSWSYVPNDTYKSTATLLKNLCFIVSRGGNFLLNIAPDPQGRWDSTTYVRLEETGAWMKINGAAIYNSKPVAPYEIKQGDTGTWVFTQVKQSIYAIWIPGETTTRKLTLDISEFAPSKVKSLNPANAIKLRKGVLHISFDSSVIVEPQVFKIN